jgi:cytochrome c5
MNRKWSFLTTVLLFSCAQLVLGQDWVIPDAESNVSNPSPYILENVDAGKDLYNLNCKSCHGDPGKNNPLALVPTPVDVASDRMHLNTEGALYYKITKGRGIMPPFEGSISEENRWKLVNFIMNFKPGGEMILVDAPPIKAKLLASVNEQNSTVEILAESEEENSTYASLVNASVIISSKRAFGNIEIGKAVTNENGRAEYRIPENSIGDEEGFMSIVVSLNDEYEAEVVYLDKARVGKMKEVPKLIKDEVLWSTNDNVSLWLLFSYLLFAGGAWAVIAYVVYQLVKVRRYSKQ